MPVFWKRPQGYYYQSRDGVRYLIKDDTPICMRHQKQEKDAVSGAKVSGKMIKIVIRVYTTEGMILDLTYFFVVPKGAEYICVVFDDTVIGLNDAFWGPNFMLPVMDSLLIMVGPNTHLDYLDNVEMFYNFIMYGVDKVLCSGHGDLSVAQE